MTTTVTRTEYQWFVRLWGAAELFHVVGNPTEILRGSPVGVLQLIMLLLAMSLVWKPHRTGLFALASLQLVVTVAKAPFLGNHEVILWLISLCIVVSILVKGDDWLRAFVPAARVVLVVAYSFIAFSKLNTGFLDVSTSCAPILAGEIGSLAGLAVVGNTPLSYVAIYGTVLAELAIPVLLITRARYGVVFALGFHFLLALEPRGHIYDFSSTLLPLFLLFLPDDVGQEAERRFGRIGKALSRDNRPLLLGLLLLAIQLLLLISNLPNWLAAYPIWLAYGAGAFVVAYGYARSNPRANGVASGSERRFGPLHPALAVVVLLTALNGLTPYLELKTGFGFNMYSNLLTARGETNHLLVPSTLHLSDTQDVMVRVVETDDPGLAYYLEEDLVIPIPSLQNYLAANPDVSASLLIGSETVRLAPGDIPPVLEGRPGWFASKFLLFRALDESEPKRCLRLWGPLY